MAISIQYKGWDFVFESMPSSEEIAKRYQDRIANTDVVMPVPTPIPLERNNGVYEQRELDGRAYAVWSPADSPLRGLILRELRGRGGRPMFEEGAASGDVETLAGAPADLRYGGLVFDITTGTTRHALDELFQFVQRYFRKLTRSAHLVVICRPEDEASSAEQAAIWEATNGFVRTVAKELGPTGSTINRLVVESGAEENAAGPLSYFLSLRAAYVSAQSVHVAVTDGPCPRPLSKVLAGKTALVTGAARGIGRATAIQFAREGATVIGVDVPSTNDLALDGSEVLLEALEAQYGVKPCLLDVSTPDAPSRLVAIAAENGGLDILVNNAAVVRDGMAFSLAEESWRRVLDVNLDACRAVPDALLDAGQLKDGARLIFIGSVASVAGNVGQVNYTTCKAGVNGLARYYAKKLAPRGMTSNAVLAGPTDTRLLRASPDWIQVIGHRLNALGQVGRPEDTANLITFVALPDSQGLTGQQIRCCGAALQGA